MPQNQEGGAGTFAKRDKHQNAVSVINSQQDTHSLKNRAAI